MDSENEMYRLVLELEIPGTGKTRIEKVFPEWGASEFSTIISEIANSLRAVGYGDKLIEKFIIDENV